MRRYVAVAAVAVMAVTVWTSSLAQAGTTVDWSDNFNGGAQQTWAVVDAGQNSTHVFQNNRYELHTESDPVDQVRALASYVNASAASYTMKARLQRLDLADNFLAYLMARVTPATMNAYVLGASSDGSHYWFGKLVGGVYQDITPTSIEATTFDPADFQLKFGVFGNTLVGKVWTTANAEPDHWQIKATDSSYASGVAGVMVATYPTFDWNVVQVAFDDVSLSTPSEVWVDDTWAGSNPGDVVGGHTFGYDAFATIQDGINAVAGSTVNVAGGNYDVTNTTLVDKSVSIIGDALDKPVIRATAHFDSDYHLGADNYLLKVVSSVVATVNLPNLVFDGNGYDVYGGLRFYGSHTGTIEDCAFTRIQTQNYAGIAIVTGGAQTIRNNTFSSIGRVGIWVGYNTPAPGCSISGNVYTGKGGGDCLDYAVEVGAGGIADLTGNTITNCTGVASSDGSKSAGILVTTYYGAGTTATITGNTITGNTDGIGVGYDAADTSVVVAHDNDLSGNTDHGVSTTAPTVDATGNYWGTLSWFGYDSVAGIKDRVEGSVTWEPWKNAARTVSYTKPATTYAAAANAGKAEGDAGASGGTFAYDAYAKIQDAINNVSGSTVNVAAGTYTAVDRALAIINKSLVLNGAGQTDDASGTILLGGTYGDSQDTTGLGNNYPRAIVVQANDVTIRNMRIKHYQGDTVTYAGYGIVARAEPAWGVTAPTIDNLIVEDVTFDDCSYGLRSQKTTGLLVQRDTYAITSGVAEYALYLRISAGTTVRANNLSAGSIWVTAASNATIGGPDPSDGNLVTDSIYNGIWLGQQFDAGTSSDGLIQNNTVHRCEEGGIVVWNWPGETKDNIRILDNTVTGAKGGSDEHGGISVYQGVFTNLVIARNDSHSQADNQPGLLLSSNTLTSATISNNVFASNPGPGIKIASVSWGNAHITNNSIAGNNGGISVSTSSGLPVDASANWYGVNTPAGVAALISGSVDYTPWIHIPGDTEPGVPGFQGNFSVLDVDDCPQTPPKGRIQEAIDLVTGSTINVAAGNYAETINLEGRSNISILGESRSTVIVKPASTLAWGAPYGASRQVAVRVYDSPGTVIRHITFDYDLVKGNMVHGVLYWNSDGELSDCVLKNMSVPDASGGYTEITSYWRAPGPPYSGAARAQVVITGNIFENTGRLAICTHCWVNATIENNIFRKTAGNYDFGYAIELGSASTGTIRNNTISGFKTTALSDGSESAGIYVENTFTSSLFGSWDCTKNVTISNNNVYDCRWALWMGNEVDGYAGNVDVVAAISNNTFHDNTSGGVFLVDEDKANGSSVNATFQYNTIFNNPDCGAYILTYGDGDITASFNGDTITANGEGVFLEDYSVTSSSSYNIDIHQCNVYSNTTYAVINTVPPAELAGGCVDATNNWWGASSGPNDPTDSDPQADNPTGTGNAIGPTGADYVLYTSWLAGPAGPTPVTGTWLRFAQPVYTVEAAAVGQFEMDVRVDNVTLLACFHFDANNPSSSGPWFTLAQEGAWWGGVTGSNFDYDTLPTAGLAPHSATGLRVLGYLSSGGATGSGSVAEMMIDYGGVSAGTYTLTLTNTELVDSVPQGISHQVGNLTLTILPAAAPTGLAWVKVPTADSTSQISMEAVAVDPSGVQYQFEVDGVEKGWQASGIYVDSGLGANTAHTYRVRARDPLGNMTGWLADLNAPTYTLAAVPGTPVLTLGTLQIGVSWAANNPALTVFELEVSIDGGATFSNIYTGTSTSFTHTGLNPNKQYTYRVRAKNGDGLYSDYSGTASGYCLPAAVGAPIVNMTPMAINGPAPKSLGIEGMALNGNPADTLIAIRIVETGEYLVQHTGNALDVMPGAHANAKWLTAAEWYKQLRGLDFDTTYTLQSVAKNGAGVEVLGGSAPYTTNKKGDANRDGKCSGMDLILVRNALNLGQQVGVDCSWALDVNDDRVVTIGDVVYIRNVILGRPTE